MQKFTINDFNAQYPDDSTWLEEIFNARYGELTVCPSCKKETKFYRIKDRKVYGCKFCGHQLSPTAGTIFHKSSTSLRDWFYALFLFANSKNGVSAKELQRQLGVTYKTAWRMAKQIRMLFESNKDQLEGIVEIDETYIGRKGKSKRWEQYDFEKKQTVMGMVERNGDMKAIHIENPGMRVLIPEIQKNISNKARIISDELTAYKCLTKLGFNHDVVNHQNTYVVGDVYTNTIEGFWSQLKRSLNGTYHTVSKKYLQQYVNEFSYRYNHRKALVPLFSLVISRAVQPL